MWQESPEKSLTSSQLSSHQQHVSCGIMFGWIIWGSKCRFHEILSHWRPPFVLMFNRSAAFPVSRRHFPDVSPKRSWFTWARPCDGPGGRWGPLQRGVHDCTAPARRHHWLHQFHRRREADENWGGGCNKLEQMLEAVYSQWFSAPPPWHLIEEQWNDQGCAV